MAIQSTTSDKVISSELGRRLAHYRLNKNLTQQDLAKEAGVGVNTVLRMEQGHSIQLSNLIRVMRVLGLADNFDQFVPAIPPSPIQQAKSKNVQRQRAFVRRGGLQPPASRQTDWQWGG